MKSKIQVKKTGREPRRRRALYDNVINVFLALAAGCCFCCASSTATPSITNPRGNDFFPQGVWRDSEKSDYSIALEKGSLTLSYGGRVQEVMVIQAVEPGRLTACRFGRNSVFRWHYDGKNLVLEDSDRRETHRLVRSETRPRELDLDIRLPDPTPLERGALEQIQRELSVRMRREQGRLRTQAQPSRPSGEALSFLKPEAEPGGPSIGGTDLELAEITTDNTNYIRQLLPRVGWIDVGRFGYSTSKAAFLLVQHSWDAPLMAAVLPALERDVKAGRMEADAYALLFDRLQLARGHRQRFGSQVANDATGSLIVLPVEEPAKVDDLRAALGMIPLKDYVRVFGASEVRFSQECQPAAGHLGGRHRR